jgi:hypothetical protein
MSVFVSHDGDGTEVYVATAKVKVIGFDEKANAVNVKFRSEHLKHDLNGWVNNEDPVVEIARAAHASGEEVEVRLESQRKKGIDRATPIAELRANNANENIIKKLAAINGTFSTEALTNPADDPEDSRTATSALGQPSRKESGAAAPVAGPSASKEVALGVLRSVVTSREVSASVVDAVKAQALLAGATPEEVTTASTIEGEEASELRSNFSYEAPTYKAFNSDGRVNLGSYHVAAGINTYNVVLDKLHKQLGEHPSEAVVQFYTQLTLAIADRIQVSAYGTGFKVDRSTGSHTRARSCIFQVIENGVSFPVVSGEVASRDEVNEFVQIVGKTARNHFLVGAEISQRFTDVNTLLASLDAVDTSDSQVAPEQNTNVQAVEPQQDEALQGEYDYPSEEPSYDEAPAQEEDDDRPSSAPQTQTASKGAPGVESDGVVWFPQTLLPSGAINSKNGPTEELLDDFKKFVIEEVGVTTKEEREQVKKLLAYTFGPAYNASSNIPEDNLGDFFDFHVASGADNFRANLNAF